MTNLKAKLGSAIAIATFLSSTVAPAAFADTTVDVVSNGAGSTNNVTINNTDNTTVNQSNNSVIINSVKTYNNTGGNQANGNTGNGDVNITTGDADTTVNVSVTGSSNTANLPDCGCSDTDTTVKVEKNGVSSNNKVTITKSKKLNVKQSNNSFIFNKVKTKNKTGWNQANGNTGNGSVDIKTGDVTTTVDISTTGSANTL